jgi:putative multiple sugar transport system permease protein
MSIRGVGIDWQQTIKGLVLLAAVAFDVYNKRRATVGGGVGAEKTGDAAPPPPELEGELASVDVPAVTARGVPAERA